MSWNWTTLPQTLTPDWIYYYRVLAEDEAWNKSNYSTLLSFILDTTAPVLHWDNTYIDNQELWFTWYAKNWNHINIFSKLTDANQEYLTNNNSKAELSSIWLWNNVSSSVYNTWTSILTWSNLVVNCSSDWVKNIYLSAMDKAWNNSNVLTTNLICDNTSPNLTMSDIISPVSWDYLSWWINHEIKWNPSFYDTELSPISNPISIDYSIDNENSWVNIASNISNSWTYNWLFPEIDNSNVKIKITAKDKLWNTQSVKTTFAVDFTPPSVSNDVLEFPNWWKILKWWENYDITWNKDKITDIVWLKNYPIKLEYSIDNWNNYTLIADNLANNWTYNWLVPTINSSEVKLKITAYDKAEHSSFDVSDSLNVIDSLKPDLSINYAWGETYGWATPPNLSKISSNWIDISLNTLDSYLSGVYYKLENKTLWKYYDSTNFSSDAPVWITLCTDSQNLGSAWNCNNIFNTLNFQVLNNNNYEIIFKSVDEAGNETISNSTNYIWDTINPDLTINWNSSEYFSWTTIISWTSSDTWAWISSVKISIKKWSLYWNWTDFVSQEQVLATQSSDNYANWNYDFSPSYLENDGQSYEVLAYSYDKSYKTNNETSKTQNLILDKTWPVLQPWILNFDTTKIYSWWSWVTISWDKTKISDSWVWIWENPIVLSYNYWTWIYVLATNLENSWSYSFVLPNNIDTTSARFFLQSTDKLWNISQSVYTNQFSIDSTDPEITEIDTKSDWVWWINWVIVYFSELIKDPESLNIWSIFSASNWITFSNSYLYNNIDWKTILELSFNSVVAWTSATPTISYNSWIIHDLAWRSLKSSSKLSLDFAEPRIISWSIFDENLNWKFDKIEVEFSENISQTTDFSTFVINNKFAWMDISWVSISWNKAILSLTESDSFNTDSSWLTLSFNSNSNYKDLAWNEAWSLWVAKSLLDKANPILLSANITDVNYVATKLELNFSETLTWAISWFSVNSGSINYLSNNNWKVTFDLSWISWTNPSLLLNYSWSLVDKNDNLLSQITNYSIKEKISPKVEYSKTLDLNNNWKIDWVYVEFSENLSWSFIDFNVTASGYNLKQNQTFSFSWSDWIVLWVDEKQNFDTNQNISLNIENNNSISDSNWNLVKALQTIVSNDGVWWVIISSRFDEWTQKMYLNFSESITWSLTSSSFELNNITWNIIWVEFNSWEDSAVLTFDNAWINYWTSEISFKPNNVFDLLWNTQSSVYYSKVTASIIINEVYNDENLKYIELKNLSNSTIDIWNYVIENALWTGNNYTIPAWKTISSNWYYLVSNTDVYYSWVTSEDMASLNIDWNLHLKNTWINVDSFWYQTFEAKKSYQRVEWCWNWLSSLCFVASVWSVWFMDNSYRWTPKSLNITDFVLPNISSYTPEQNSILPKSNNVNFSFTYDDAWVWVQTWSVKFEIKKYNNWNFDNYLNANIQTWSINSINSSFISNISEYWRYKAVFEVWDYAWNVKTQNIDFYVDEFSVTINSNNIDIWDVSQNIAKYSNTLVDLNITTIWASFVVNHSYNTNDLWDFVSNKWFGWCLWESCTTLENYKNKDIISVWKSISTDWTLKNYNYKVKYWVLVDNLTSAWNYNVDNIYKVSVSY